MSQSDIMETCVNCKSNELTLVHEITVGPDCEEEDQVTNEETRNKTITVKDALTLLYNLDCVKEYNDIISQSAVFGLCVECGNILKYLFDFYTQFDRLRQVDSFLDREIVKIGKTIQLLKDEYKNNSGQSNKEEQVNPDSSSKLRSDEIILKCQAPGPWVRLERLQPQDIIAIEKPNKSVHYDDDDEFQPPEEDSDDLYVPEDDMEGSDPQNEQLSCPKSPNIKKKKKYDKKLSSRSCKKCDLQFSTWTQLVRHWNEHSDRQYACSNPKCLRRFVTKEKLEAHSAKCLKIICSVCGTHFRRQGDLARHLLSHTKEKKFKCEELGCGKSFMSKSQLVSHQRQHHTGERPYKCDFEGCSWTFTCKQNVTNHMNSVHGPRSILCSVCGKSFSRQPSLTRHMLCHTKEAHYKCHFCEKAFTLPHNLKAHLLLHTNDKPYLCQTCGSSFRQQHHLKRHEQTHTKILPFTCKVCGLSFPDNRPLKKHLLSQHNLTLENLEYM